MNRDWLFKTEDSVCQLRTAGVLVRDGKVLVQRDGHEYALPGGHVQIGETTVEGLIREYREETGTEIRVDRLLWTEECIWTWNGKRMHDLAFYYRITLCDEAALPDSGAFVPQKDNGRIVLGWLPMEQLASLEIYPDFLKEQIFCLDGPPRHFITRI